MKLLVFLRLDVFFSKRTSIGGQWHLKRKYIVVRGRNDQIHVFNLIGAYVSCLCVYLELYCNFRRV